jgi:hypothetical protein
MESRLAGMLANRARGRGAIPIAIQLFGVGSVGKGETLRESVERAASVEDLFFYLRTSEAGGRFTVFSFDEPGCPD